jgi:hypothetical protein
MTHAQALTELTPGMKLLVGGNLTISVSEALAAAFRPGDSLANIERTEQILHIPETESQVAEAAVSRTLSAFAELG